MVRLMSKSLPSIAYATPQRVDRPPGRWLRLCTYWSAACPLTFLVSVHATYLAKYFELGRWPIYPDGRAGPLVFAVALSFLASVIVIFMHPVFAIVLTAAELIDRRPRHAIAAFCTFAVWPCAYVMKLWDPIGAFDWVFD
jgi:hypothetical protein